MGVAEFNLVSVALLEPETNPPLVVHGDGVLTGTIPIEGVETIARRHTKVLQLGSRVGEIVAKFPWAAGMLRAALERQTESRTCGSASDRVPDSSSLVGLPSEPCASVDNVWIDYETDVWQGTYGMTIAAASAVADQAGLRHAMQWSVSGFNDSATFPSLGFSTPTTLFTSFVGINCEAEGRLAAYTGHTAAAGSGLSPVGSSDSADCVQIEM